MKKLLSVTILLLVLILSLASCELLNGNIDSLVNFHAYGDWTMSVKPTCEKDGEYARYCSCGAKESKVIPALGHTPTDAVIEDEVEPTYDTDGGYKEVVRCSVCKEKISETSHVIPMLKHNPGEPVKENVTEATCYREGGYDIVTYCLDCGEEVERIVHHTPKTEHTPSDIVEDIIDSTCSSTGSKSYVIYCSVPECHAELEKDTIIIDKKAHTPADAVKENVVKSSCYSEGSYDSVIYCSDCSVEISRTNVTLAVIGHTFANAVEENRVDATCYSEGSYESVIYCSDCSVELSRTNVTLTKTSHTFANAVEENRVDATCYAEGSYDSVIYCSVCSVELSRTNLTLQMIAHAPADTVEENKVLATCYAEGSYDDVIYCSVCSIEISRTGIVLQKIDHTPANAVVENKIPARCTVDGSYDEVVYCSSEGCHKELSRAKKVISALGHTELTVEAVAPTCNRTGLTQGSRCSTCKTVFVAQEIIPLIDHSYNAESICTVCGFYLDEGLVFQAMGDSYSVIEYTGSASEVVIPTLYNGKPVVEIGTYSFYNNKTLISVIIPDGVTRIGSDAFYNCSNLESIILPDTLLSLEAWVFYGCPKLVYEQYDNAYYLGSTSNPYLVLVKAINTDIESCEIAPDTKFLHYSAFRNCNNLTEVTIPESVIHISGYVFEYCNNLQYNEYDNAYYLGSETNPYYALIEAKEKWAITSCEIHEDTKLIAGRAFASCTKLTSIEIPYGITTINFRAFECCYELTEVKIPDSVVYIEHEAFYRCDKLNSITIPDSVHIIGRSAFQSTPTLNVVLGSGVEKVDNLAFSGGSRNSKVYYNGTEEEWNKIYVEPSPSYMSGCRIDEYIRYFYSEEQPTTSGRYWHYVDGVPTEW